MNLNETLTLIAAQVHCDAKDLIAYAAEDTLGGYHIDETQRLWPMGSAWAVELQTLYALIRQFKPTVIVEIGGWVGASASHMALACKANGIGHVTSVDNGVGGQPHGYMIPDYLREFVTLVPEDGRIWLAKQDPQSIGFLFEDADHSTPLVMELSRLALNKIEPGGILATHDAAHDFAIVGGGQWIDSPVGRAVRDGLAQAGLHFTPYLAEPSDCGLAITVIPGVRMDKHSIKTSEWLKDEPKGFNNPHHFEKVELKEQFGGSNSAQGQGVISEVPQQIGNANIESASEPPPPIEAKEDPTPKAKPTTKRGKGKRTATK